MPVTLPLNASALISFRLNTVKSLRAKFADKFVPTIPPNFILSAVPSPLIPFPFRFAIRLVNAKSISFIERSLILTLPFSFGLIGFPPRLTKPLAVIFECSPIPGIGNDIFCGTEISIFKFGLERFFTPPSKVAIHCVLAKIPEFSRSAELFSIFISV